MKKYILFLFVFIQSVGFSQSLVIDSLNNELKKSNIDSSLVFYKIGNIYYDISEYDQAMDYYLKSFKRIENSGNEQRKADILNVIGNIYFNHQKNYKKSLEYYSNSLEISIKLDDKFGEALLYNNIGISYSSLKEYDLALEYLLKSYNIKTEINDTASIYITLSNIGELYYEKKEYEKAIEYFRKSIKLNNDDYWGIANTLNNISKYYLVKNDIDSVKLNLQKSIDISKKNSFKSLLKDSYLIFSKMYSKQNNIELLEKYNRLYLSISDSIYNERSLRLLIEMQTKYETKEKEKENKLLKAEEELKNQKLVVQSNKIIALIVGIILIFISSLLFFIQLRNQRKANKALVGKNLEIVEREKEIQNAKEEIETQFEKFKEGTKNQPKNLDVKYSSSDLQDEQKQEIINAINNLMDNEKPYLNSEFSLKEIAKNINSSRTYVSQVINEHYYCNFNTFINDYRIREARRKLSDPTNKNITIEAIANEVGFKSKTSFNNAFKKFTGVTPSFYLKSLG